MSKPIVELTKSTDYLFHSSGREDVDVRMLGNSRPFLLEIKNSKIEKLNKIQLDAMRRKSIKMKKSG